jgi:hypothetical protein
MMRKKEVYKTITPIPSHIPRQLAIDILHSHSEIITLNPLVLEHKPIPAPRDAAADEYYATWYEIIERIQYIPGIGKMGSGKISFKGCFHDVPWGVDTHVLAPANVDLRNNWRIAGNQPGEPPEPRELGVNAPAEGLYLREDIQIRCNFAMVSFVKSQLRAASKVLVDRLIKKAELLDAGELLAMMENGKLKTINPADRSKTMQSEISQPPQQQQQQPLSSRLPYQVPRSPTFPQRPGTAGEQSSRYSYIPHPQESQGLGLASTTMELPGDFYYTSTSSESSRLNPRSYSPTKRDSAVSELSGSSPDVNTGRWSDYPKSPNSSRPTSYISDASGPRSPGLDHKSFAAELPAMDETREEYDKGRAAALKKGEAYGSVEP